MVFMAMRLRRPQEVRADSRFVPSQCETVLLCNDVSHWLGARLESVLEVGRPWGPSQYEDAILPIQRDSHDEDKTVS